MQVKDKVIVVTGGASGIGRAMVRRFHQDGAQHLVVADIDGGGAEAVAAEVGGTGVALDVTSEDQTRELIERTEQDIGPIALYCANAGIGYGGGADTPNAQWQHIWDVNLMAHVYSSRHLIPRMAKRGGGYLLHTASAAGLLSQIGSASYAVTKHAAVAYAEWLAISHSHEGIKVSVLCPQAVRTAMTADNEEGVASIDGMMEPEQVADEVVQTLADERFLVLPHKEVLEYMQRKAGDYDRWLGGMQRLNDRYRS